MIRTLIPAELWRRITEFMEARKTGKIVLNLSEGRILSWEVVEHGRLAQHLPSLDKT